VNFLESTTSGNGWPSHFQAGAQVEDFAGVDFDIRSLPREPAHRLVDLDAGIRQREALALLAPVKCPRL
jgi:hypothetical protein